MQLRLVEGPVKKDKLYHELVFRCLCCHKVFSQIHRKGSPGENDDKEFLDYLRQHVIHNVISKCPLCEEELAVLQLIATRMNQIKEEVSEITDETKSEHE